MAETSGSLLQQAHTLRSFHSALDPKSLILSQFSNFNKPQLLQLTTESSFMERGPRYREYCDLRDRKLRMRNSTDKRIAEEKEPDEKIHNRSILTPPKKQVKFSSNLTTPPKRAKAPSVLTQSVPDFSSALRKENRRPVNLLPPVAERSLTPPGKSVSVYGKAVFGSKSASSVEKRSGGMMARKSYASMEGLKGLAVAAGNAINGENRGGRNGRGVGKTVLGYRQF